MADRRCCSSFCGWRSICSFASRELVECKLLFRLRGSVIPRAALFALPSAALSVLMHYRLGTLSSVPANAGNVNAVWSSVTFVLGVLLVFRTNQAYARYWEGATLLMQVRGEWLNASSSLVAFCSVVPEMTAEVAKFQHQLVRLMSLLYCGALQQVSFVKDDSMEVIDMAGLDESSLFFLVESEERCDVILQWIRRLIVLNMSSGVIPVPPPILTRVFQELSRGLVAAKDVQKIAEFPFPFPYTQLILVMLVTQTLLTPIMAAAAGEDPIWSSLVVFTSVLVQWSMNYTAAELEQPFGEDYNDLPICDMMKEMNLRLQALLDERVRTPPEFFASLEMIEPGTVSCAESGYVCRRKWVEGFAKARSRSMDVVSMCSSNFPWMNPNISVTSAVSIQSLPVTKGDYQVKQSSPSMAAVFSDPTGLDPESKKSTARRSMPRLSEVALGNACVSIPPRALRHIPELSPVAEINGSSGAASSSGLHSFDMESQMDASPSEAGASSSQCGGSTPGGDRTPRRKNRDWRHSGSSLSDLAADEVCPRRSIGSCETAPRSSGSYEEIVEFACDPDGHTPPPSDLASPRPGCGSPASGVATDPAPSELRCHGSATVPLRSFSGTSQCVVAM
mmetsp:Transcript_85187/g.246297  ORF Transcript_85187/g.246297 Transcript_85187/m.246297 type:complete len:620 (-) Transcript_85187:255-2114(-)